MAPQHMEYNEINMAGYTHKKFNSVQISHKKFGKRMLKRTEITDEKENINSVDVNTKTIKTPIEVQTTLTDNTCSKRDKGIFRPYAMDQAETPRKRKLVEVTNKERNPVPCKKLMTTARRMVLPAVQERVCEALNVAAIQHLQQQYHQQQYHQQLHQEQQYHQQLQHNIALNKQAYFMMLQRQRAALYMNNLMQITGNGNGWPAAPIMNNGC